MTLTCKLVNRETLILSWGFNLIFTSTTLASASATGSVPNTFLLLISKPISSTIPVNSSTIPSAFMVAICPNFTLFYIISSYFCRRSIGEDEIINSCN